MSMRFLDTAFNWAERKDVSVVAVRDHMDRWHVQLQFKDSAGSFSGTVASFDPRKGTKGGKKKPDGTPPETEDAYQRRVAMALDQACVRIRRGRTANIVAGRITIHTPREMRGTGVGHLLSEGTGI